MSKKEVSIFSGHKASNPASSRESRHSLRVSWYSKPVSVEPDLENICTLNINRTFNTSCLVYNV